MKEKSLIIKTMQLLVIIPLYYIIGSKEIFAYVLSLSLYNIFLSCFANLSFKEAFDEFQDNHDKFKFLKISILSLAILSSLFLLMSILISDISSTILKINDIFLVFLFMGLSIICEPLLNLFNDYLISSKKSRKSKIIYQAYYKNELVLLLIISLLSFKIFNIPKGIKLSLLYLPKIISLISILILVGIVIKKDRIGSSKSINNNKYNYRLALKKIFRKNYHTRIIKIVKNSYYYLSIIILYLILTTRYNYAIDTIGEDIVFVYFYFLTIVNYYIEIITEVVKRDNPNQNLINYILSTLKVMLPIAIITCIISPLVCKIIFNKPDKAIYLIMASFMAIFIALFNIATSKIKKTKAINIVLFSGLLCKILITIPLINAVYRMGYNLIYGDIVSTIIGLLVSVIVSYFLTSSQSQKEEKHLDKILNILYENIILAIILIVVEFIIPIDYNSYFKSLVLIIVYVIVGIIFLKFKNKYIE